MAAVSMLMSSFSANDRFSWNPFEGFRISVPSGLTYTWIPRESASSIHKRLFIVSQTEDGRSNNQELSPKQNEQEKNYTWWLAQACHYGVNISYDRDMIKEVMRQSILTGYFKVPQRLKILEETLEKRYVVPRPALSANETVRGSAQSSGLERRIHIKARSISDRLLTPSTPGFEAQSIVSQQALLTKLWPNKKASVSINGNNIKSKNNWRCGQDHDYISAPLESSCDSSTTSESNSESSPIIIERTPAPEHMIPKPLGHPLPSAFESELHSWTDPEDSEAETSSQDSIALRDDTRLIRSLTGRGPDMYNTQMVNNHLIPDNESKNRSTKDKVAIIQPHQRITVPPFKQSKNCDESKKIDKPLASDSGSGSTYPRFHTPMAFIKRRSDWDTGLYAGTPVATPDQNNISRGHSGSHTYRTAKPKEDGHRDTRIDTRILVVKRDLSTDLDKRVSNLAPKPSIATPRPRLGGLFHAEKTRRSAEKNRRKREKSKARKARQIAQAKGSKQAALARDLTSVWFASSVAREPDTSAFKPLNCENINTLTAESSGSNGRLPPMQVSRSSHGSLGRSRHTIITKSGDKNGTCRVFSHTADCSEREPVVITGSKSKHNQSSCTPTTTECQHPAFEESTHFVQPLGSILKREHGDNPFDLDGYNFSRSGKQVTFASPPRLSSDSEAFSKTLHSGGRSYDDYPDVASPTEGCETSAGILEDVRAGRRKQVRGKSFQSGRGHMADAIKKGEVSTCEPTDERTARKQATSFGIAESIEREPRRSMYSMKRPANAMGLFPC